MGKRQVKNENALKEIKLPEEGEMFSRIIKMIGGENVLVKCDDDLLYEEEFEENSKEEFGLETTTLL